MKATDKRVIIIGSSGSGKTTLARELAAKLDIPHTELDSIYHQQNWQPSSDVDFTAAARAIAETPAWILCGNYYAKIGATVWPRADVIIWCDYSFGLVLGRLLRRTIYNCFTKRELWNGNRESFYTNFLTNKSVIAFMVRKWKEQNRRYDAIFRSPKQLAGVELIRLAHPREAQDLLDKLN
jgi:adenylate kinase family enzyme